MLTKESKIRVLESYYALDYAIFGKPVKRMESCCLALIEDYINVKGALLSVMIEMYKLVEFSPTKLTEKVNMSALSSMAKKSAAIARENCQKLVVTEKGKQDIKAELKEALATSEDDINIEDIVKEKIREKAFSLAVDNLLIARTLSECDESALKKLNDWEGRILEDAYKVLRDSLVVSAADILTMHELTK